MLKASKKAVFLIVLAIFSLAGIFGPGYFSSAAGANFAHQVFTVAEGWQFGSDEYWHLRPQNEKNEFKVGQKVQFFAQVGPIYVNHQWQLKLYQNGNLYRQITADPFIVDPYFGWHYSNFVPFINSLPAGNYRADYYLDQGSGFALVGSKEFTVAPAPCPYVFDHAITALAWQYGNGSDYWNLQPVKPQTEFFAGQTVYLLAQVRNIYADHRWKVELYRDNTFLWSYQTPINHVGAGWVYGNFYPYFESVQPGNYEAKVYIDIGNGYQLLASRSFSVESQGQAYVFARAVVANGWQHGTSTDYWDIQPVKPQTEFFAGQTVYLVAQVRNIYADHRWKVELYRDGLLVWHYQTPLNEVGLGWTYSNFYPYYANIAAGNYQFKVYLNTGAGDVLLATRPFVVNP